MRRRSSSVCMCRRALCRLLKLHATWITLHIKMDDNKIWLFGYFTRSALLPKIICRVQQKGQLYCPLLAQLVRDSDNTRPINFWCGPRPGRLLCKQPIFSLNIVLTIWWWCNLERAVSPLGPSIEVLDCRRCTSTTHFSCTCLSLSRIGPHPHTMTSSSYGLRCFQTWVPRVHSPQFLPQPALVHTLDVVSNTPFPLQ